MSIEKTTAAEVTTTADLTALPAAASLGDAIIDLPKLLLDSNITDGFPLSFSKANTLAACPYMYKKRYVEKAKGGVAYESEPAKVGKFIHSVFEQCIQKGVNFGFTTEAADFAGTWKVNLPSLTSKEMDMAMSMRPNAQALLSRVFKSITQQELKPTVELRCLLTLDGRSANAAKWGDLLFNGFIDLLITDKKVTSAVVIDWKTHEKPEEQSEDEVTQTKIYSYLLFKRFPTLQVIRCGCGYVPSNDIDYHATYTRSDNFDSLQEFFYEFLRAFVVKRMDTERVGFAKVGSKRCDWCAFHEDCEGFVEYKKQSTKAKGRTSNAGAKRGKKATEGSL